MSCRSVHQQCNFTNPHDNACSRCSKHHLLCCFQLSGKQACLFRPSPTSLLMIYHYFIAQGIARNVNKFKKGKVVTSLPIVHHPPASLVPPILPNWIHVFYPTCTSTSRRTQAAAVAHMFPSITKISTFDCINLSAAIFQRICSLLRPIVLPNHFTPQLPTLEDIDKSIYVCDGGSDYSLPECNIKNGKPWTVLKVGQHLHVPDISNPAFGVTGQYIGGTRSYFLIPRIELFCLIPSSGWSDVYDSLEQVLHINKSSLSRGKKKTVFGDVGVRVKYKCIGVRPSMNSSEVIQFPSWSEKLGSKHWSNIMRLVGYVESVFEASVDRNVLLHISAARQVVKFKTMSAPQFDVPIPIPSAKYFGGVAFGKNVFLRAHVDDDFTFSVALVLLKGSDLYTIADDVVVHFCYPTHGIAIPMKPGDILPFNSRVPHCISSRQNFTDEIMCISLYLKTSVVGLNNNAIPVDSLQQCLSDHYRNIRSNK